MNSVSTSLDAALQRHRLCSLLAFAFIPEVSENLSVQEEGQAGFVLGQRLKIKITNSNREFKHLVAKEL